MARISFKPKIVQGFDGADISVIQNGEHFVDSTTGVSYYKDTSGNVKEGVLEEIKGHPSVAPTLMLDFARSESVDARISFQRTSQGTYFDREGVMRIAKVNEPRIDYDPITRKCMGLLIEQSVTNFILHSDFKTGKPWGPITGDAAEGAINTSQVAPDGKAGVRKISCTLNSVIRFGSTTGGTAGSVYTGSLWIASADGTEKTVNIDVNDMPSKSFTVGPTLTRISHNGTNTSQSLRFFDLTLPPGEYYVWGAQLEAVRSATSYIATEGSVVTRSADISSIPLEKWFRRDEGTFILQCDVGSIVDQGGGISFGVSSTSIIYFGSGGTRSYSGTGTTNDVTSNGRMSGKTGYSWNSSGREVVSFSGVSKSEPLFLRTDTAVNLFFGAGLSNFYNQNGHIQSVIFFPKKMETLQLKTLCYTHPN